jgi:hypothetical protein
LRDHRLPPWVCRQERDLLLSATECLDYDPVMKKPSTFRERLCEHRAPTEADANRSIDAQHG